MSVVREFVIGRDESCDVRVDDEYASKRHARVWMDDQGLAWIEDLGTTNGTWLGGGPLEGGQRVYGPTRLVAGTAVYVGRTTIPWSA